MIKTKNAVIKKTELGWEDHGIFTFTLTLDYGDSQQCAGQYSLDQFVKEKKKRVGTALGLDLIMAIMKTIGVQTWEELAGKHIRVKADFGKVHAIAPLLGGKWLDFKKFYAEAMRKQSTYA